MRLVVFEWVENNLRKLRAHRITANEVEQALARDPILVYEQDAGGESRHVYYGETHRSRLLAIVITESKDLILVITAYDLDAGQKRDYLTRRAEGARFMSKTQEPVNKPKFRNEDEEAKWWASADGRRFLGQQSAARRDDTPTGSPLVSQLNKTSSVQIALRLPAPDVAQAREIAQRKGIGYQTLLKMLVHEGLQREARRK